jgi:prolipoprotein diacylglyceryl transferase
VSSVLALLAAIPSPPARAIHIGELQLRAYGAIIALGVVVAVAITRRRWAERGHDPDDISSVAVWGVVGGLVGARLYHVATDAGDYVDRPLAALEVWEGGLGIWGAVAGGVLGVVLLARRRGLAVTPLLDAIAVGLPVAQAIGRFGNWFNQEVFGRPTDLPWALEIDPARRPDGYEAFPTFHPTFLYEALWCVAIAGVLVLVDRRWRPRPGGLFAAYVALYTFGRFWIELLRIDPATELVGVRINVFTSVAVFVGALVVVWGLRPRSGAADAGAVRGPGGRGDELPADDGYAAAGSEGSTA